MLIIMIIIRDLVPLKRILSALRLDVASGI